MAMSDPPTQVMYAINSDELSVGDWILYRKARKTEARPRIGQITALHAPELGKSSYMSKQQEEILLQGNHEALKISDYVEKCFVMHSSYHQRDKGYPNPSNWHEPMSLFISDTAVSYAGGVIARDLEVWNRALPPGSEYRGLDMVANRDANWEMYINQSSSGQLEDTDVNPWFSKHLEATDCVEDTVEAYDLHHYWRASHPRQPLTRAEVVKQALAASKDSPKTCENREIHGIRCIRWKSAFLLSRCQVVESVVGKEEAECWLIANYVPSTSGPPASVEQTALWSGWRAYLSAHKLTSKVTAAELIELPAVIFGANKPTVTSASDGVGKAYLVTGIKPRSGSLLASLDRSAAVDLVRWFCGSMELDPFGSVSLDIVWSSLCSSHPNVRRSSRGSIIPSLFSSYLTDIRPDLLTTFADRKHKIALMGVRLVNKGGVVDPKKALGRNLTQVYREDDVASSADTPPSSAAAGSDGASSSGNDHRRKAGKEVEAVDSPEAKRRRKDSGFHEMAAVSAAASTPGAAPQPSSSTASARSPVVSPAHPPSTSSAPLIPIRPATPIVAPSTSTSTYMARSSSLPSRLAAVPSPNSAQAAAPPPVAMQRAQTSQGDGIPPPSSSPSATPANSLTATPIPPQLQPSVPQVAAPSPSVSHTPAGTYLWKNDSSSMQKMKLSEFMQMMIDADEERAEGYVAAFSLLQEAMIAPDIMLELGTQGLAQCGVKTGCAVKIVMALRGDLMRA